MRVAVPKPDMPSCSNYRAKETPRPRTGKAMIARDKSSGTGGESGAIVNFFYRCVTEGIDSGGRRDKGRILEIPAILVHAKGSAGAGGKGVFTGGGVGQTSGQIVGDTFCPAFDHVGLRPEYILLGCLHAYILSCLALEHVTCS